MKFIIIVLHLFASRFVTHATKFDHCHKVTVTVVIVLLDALILACSSLLHKNRTRHLLIWWGITFLINISGSLPI